MGFKALLNPNHPVILSYRKLALKFHPLKCQEPWGPKRFQQLAEAYDVLSDRKWRVSPSTDCRGRNRGVYSWQDQPCDPQPSWELAHTPMPILTVPGNPLL